MSGHPMVVVLGPTASGKSDLALAVAAACGGEIVNCDSLQLYRHMNIGTAKTPVEERRGIPHHLIDIIDPGRTFTAGEYSRLARGVVQDVAARGRVPVVVGGTGFYLRALLEGLFEGPVRDDVLRARLARRPERLHRLLARLDPAAASRIHPNDTKKIVRAIEVCVIAHHPISKLQPQQDPLTGFSTLRLGLAPPRDALYSAINFRCKRMFDEGIIEETHFVVEHFGRHAKALEAIGYAEAAKVLDGLLSIEEAIGLAQMNTRRYAKRQTTWFHREPDVIWFPTFGNQEQTVDAAIRYAENLKNNLA